jgi:hypothetical protein
MKRPLLPALQGRLKLKDHSAAGATYGATYFGRAEHMSVLAYRNTSRRSRPISFSVESVKDSLLPALLWVVLQFEYCADAIAAFL